MEVIVMRKLLLALFVGVCSLSVLAQESISVPARCYSFNNNQCVGNSTITLRMARDLYGPTMVIEIKPYPNNENGLIYAFNQGPECNSTFQAIVVGDDCGWIATTKMSQFPESERQHIALFQGTDGSHRLYIFKKDGPYGEPQYLHGCYLTLTAQDEWNLRRYFVEKGNQYNIFKNLDLLKE